MIDLNHDGIDDRAERPDGLLAWLRDALATALAAEPETPPQFSPPRGLGLLPALLAQVTAAPARAVLPPNPPVKLPSGYEYRIIPADLWASRAGLDPDVAALAWCLASEASHIGRYPAYSWAIAEAVVNAAVADMGHVARSPVPVLERVTSDRRAAVRGHYGRQGARWCSSFQPPTWRQVECAKLVLARARAGEPNILARGAVQWLDCETQVAMNKKKPATNPIPEMVMARRYDSGRKWVGPIVDALGTVVLDSWRLMLIGKEGVDRGTANEALADGRKRWRR